MKNFDFTSLQINRFQQTLDRIYGKGRFLIGCIFLLFGLLFFTSCASEPRDARNGLPTGRQERGHEESRRTPPVAIRIEDTTQENIPAEELEVYGDHPVVRDAYFAEARDGEYHRIERAVMKDTVYIVVDTLNLAGEQIEVRLCDNKEIITGNIPFQQYINTNADATMEEAFQQTSINVNGVFTGIVRNIDRGEGVHDRRKTIIKIEFKATDDETTAEWIRDLRNDSDREMDLYITVNVPNIENIVYCGSNHEEEENRKTDPDNNVWLNQEEKYFKLKYCRCCEYTVENTGYMTGENITENAIASCNNSGALNNCAIIVLHRTAGGVASGTLNHMSNEGYGAHFVIDNATNTDGEVYHAISLNNRGAHMGAGQYPATVAAGWGNPNSVGIEVCGYSYDSNGNARVGNNTNRHDHWQDVTDEQASSVACLVKFLLRHYSLSLGDVKVHEELCNKTEDEGQTVHNAMMRFWH